MANLALSKGQKGKIDHRAGKEGERGGGGGGGEGGGERGGGGAVLPRMKIRKKKGKLLSCIPVFKIWKGLQANCFCFWGEGVCRKSD